MHWAPGGVGVSRWRWRADHRHGNLLRAQDAGELATNEGACDNCEAMQRRAVLQSNDPGGFAEEKQFYLDEFRNRTLLFSLSWREVEEKTRWFELQRVVDELITSGTRVILCLGVERDRVPLVVQELHARWPQTTEAAEYLPGLQDRGAESGSVQLAPAAAPLATEFLIGVWLRLRQQPFSIVLFPVGETEQLVLLAEELAARLRVHKWVIVDAVGGIRDRSGEVLSFMDGALLETLMAAGQAEWAGLGERRAIFASAHRALSGGAASVNVCDLSGLERELFTYLGSGTLFTLSDYCAVKRLSIDDFAEVERLLRRGEREGVLKPRSLPELARILIHGYGATIGGGHLAGFCSLETERYAPERAGEVVALYTITRFKGEGIGRKLLARVTADARALGLEYLFACTVAPQARAFFEREGFRVVTPAQVPPAKWQGYDPARKKRVLVLRKDLDATGEA